MMFTSQAFKLSPVQHVYDDVVKRVSHYADQVS